MPIAKINAAQFAEEIQQGILTRDREWDVFVGEIPDLVVNPHAPVFERQHGDVRKVNLMMTLANPDEFEGEFEVDLEGIVLNEGMLRSLGGQASVTLVFSRSAAPTSDLRVQRGRPIGTEPDEGSGATITFVTTEERTLFAASASSFFNIETQRYELSVPAVAVVEGLQGRVGPRRVNRPLTPLLGFDSVTNPQQARGGRDRETNAELIDRYLIAILGRGEGTSTGIRKVTTDDFPDVEDVLVVSGTDPLLTRAGDTAGAVDVYIIGDETIEVIENPVFLGAGQLIQIELPPVTEIVSVQDLSVPITYVEGVDYDVTLDTTGFAGSVRARSGVTFRFTGTSALPAIGNPVTITYTLNNLIRRLQVTSETDDRDVKGRDLLYKQGIAVPIALEANLRVDTGRNTTTILNAVRTAVLAFINNTLRLGARVADSGSGVGETSGAVEESDIQRVVRQVTGVDNFIITRLTRLTVPAGIADIPIAGNEHPTLEAADLIITII